VKVVKPGCVLRSGDVGRVLAVGEPLAVDEATAGTEKVVLVDQAERSGEVACGCVEPL
jgi:hypothetical protein